MADGMSLRGVTAGYGERTALRDVSVEVRPGEVVGLVGPNGSGKTTLVRVASRALRPWEGSVSVAGLDPFSMRARHAARLVAVVPQDVGATFPFTVLEMVLLGRSPHRTSVGRAGSGDWAAARAAMEAANVQHLADRGIDELSGGERQRVMLAQALAQDAPVLLLDEPTTHLDVRHVLDLLGLVRALAARERKAVLAIFHDLNLAAATADRMYALSEGRVVAEGAPEEVVTPGLLRTVYGVEAEVHPDPFTGRPAVGLGPPPSRTDPWAHATVHVVGGAGRAAPLVRALAERGFDVTVGVLHATDTDATVAERLNLLRVTVPPFSPIDDEAARECLDLMTRAAAVVVCDAPYGPGNLANLRLALAAADRGTPVLLLEQVPMSERDFTGGEASGLWEELRRRAAAVAERYEDVLAGVGSVAGDGAN